MMEYEKFRNYTEEQLNVYWGARMEQRMEDSYEATILINVMKGYFFQQAQYDAIRGYKEYDDLEDFWGSKRPYGNKALPESIAFTLGWDRDRSLCVAGMPKWVEEEAMRIHDIVKGRLSDEWGMHTDYIEYLKDHYESLRNTRSVHGLDNGGVETSASSGQD